MAPLPSERWAGPFSDFLTIARIAVNDRSHALTGERRGEELGFVRVYQLKAIHRSCRVEELEQDRVERQARRFPFGELARADLGDERGGRIFLRILGVE